MHVGQRALAGAEAQQRWQEYQAERLLLARLAGARNAACGSRPKAALMPWGTGADVYFARPVGCNYNVSSRSTRAL